MEIKKGRERKFKKCEFLFNSLIVLLVAWEMDLSGHQCKTVYTTYSYVCFSNKPDR